MQITKEWLQEHDACSSGMEFVEENNLIGLEGIEFVRKLMKYEQYEYANWLIVRIMDHEQCKKYAQLATDLVKKYAASAAKYAVERAGRDAEMAIHWKSRAERAAFWAASAEKMLYKEVLTFGLQLLERNKQ